MLILPTSRMPFRRTQRPLRFVLNREHELYRGLQCFYGGGIGVGTTRYHDSGPYGLHGTLTGFTNPAAAWGSANGRGIINSDGSGKSIIAWPYAPLPVSMFCWLRATSTSADQYPATIYGPNFASDTIGSLTNSSGQVIARYRNSDAKTTGAVVLNAWYPVLAVFAATNSRTIYAIGEVVTNTGAENAIAGSLTLSLCCRRGAVSFWPGQIADLVVWSREVSAAEYSLLASPDPMYGGFILPQLPRRTYFTPANTPVTPTATKKFLPVRRSNWAARPLRFKLDRHRLNDGLQGAYFGGIGVGTTRYHDSSPYGKHGSLSGFADPSAAWSMQRGRMCVQTTPAGMVDCGTRTQLTGNCTLSWWMKKTDSLQQYVVTNGLYPFNNVAIYAEGTTVQLSWVQGNALGGFGINGTLGVWQHWAVTRTGSAGAWTLMPYLNGIPGSPATTATNPVGDAYPILLGNNVEATSSTAYADVCFWDRALDPIDIRLLASPDLSIGGWLRRQVDLPYWPDNTASTTKYWLAGRRSRIIGGGVS